MADLNDLHKPLSECSMEELQAMIKGIRTSRRTPKATANKPAKTKQAKPSTPISTAALISSMSQDDIDALLKQMEGMQK